MADGSGSEQVVIHGQLYCFPVLLAVTVLSVVAMSAATD
jgi:hypothetical protein